MTINDQSGSIYNPLSYERKRGESNQFASLDLFADREQQAADVLVQSVIAHRSETPVDVVPLIAKDDNLEHVMFWCQTQIIKLCPLSIALAVG